jgi:hypothetical protein
MDVVRAEERYSSLPLVSSISYFYRVISAIYTLPSLHNFLAYLSLVISSTFHRNRLPPSQLNTHKHISNATVIKRDKTRYQETKHMHAHHLVIFLPLQTSCSEMQIIPEHLVVLGFHGRHIECSQLRLDTLQDIGVGSWLHL